MSDSWLMIYNLLKSVVYLRFDGSKGVMFTEKGNHERRITTEMPAPHLWKLTESHSEKREKNPHLEVPNSLSTHHSQLHILHKSPPQSPAPRAKPHLARAALRRVELPLVLTPYRKLMLLSCFISLSYFLPTSGD